LQKYKDIEVGKTYNNFKRYERVVKDIHETSNGKVKVTYDDFTGKYKTCEYNSFITWTQRKYY